MFWPFKKKTIQDHFYATKKVKVAGIVFQIKKIDPLDHLQGIKALQSIYSTYKIESDKSKKQAQSEDIVKTTQKWCREVLLAGVVSPKLSAKADGSGFFVDEIIRDVAMSQELAMKILDFTYDKKKRAMLPRI